MKKSATTTIEKLSHEGRGIAHIDGKITFIDNALPGETVEFQYLKKNRQFAEGVATNIIHPSPERIEAKCPHFGVCGGCRLQHISTDNQLTLHQEAILQQLAQAKLVPNTIVAPLTSDIWGYRHKARLGAKYLASKELMVVGFRERDGRFITKCQQCDVLHPSVGQALPELIAMLKSLSIRDQIPQCEVAVSDQESALILRHLKPLTEQDLNVIREQATKQQWKIYLQPKGLDSIKLFYPSDATPLMQYQLPDHDLTLEYHPAQFTQVNPAINKLMINQALAWLDLKKTDRVLDLFCGIGNFTLPVAKHVNTIVGVEGDHSAVERAQANANLNHITNAEFYKANLFEDMSQANWARGTYNKLLLDPPRAGADCIVTQIDQWQPEVIVYVSCNPATFIRDSQTLAKQGYRLTKFGIMNMFPHTGHIEVMGQFMK